MLSKNLQHGSSINASKPVGVLNNLTRSGTILAWYQDKPIGVLNMLVGSGTMLAWYQGKLVGVLNMLANSGEILGKIDMVNTPLCTWFVEQ